MTNWKHLKWKSQFNIQCIVSLNVRTILRSLTWECLKLLNRAEWSLKKKDNILTLMRIIKPLIQGGKYNCLYRVNTRHCPMIFSKVSFFVSGISLQTWSYQNSTDYLKETLSRHLGSLPSSLSSLKHKEYETTTPSTLLLNCLNP